jgi:hypothetical protein
MDPTAVNMDCVGSIAGDALAGFYAPAALKFLLSALELRSWRPKSVELCLCRKVLWPSSVLISRT